LCPNPSPTSSSTSYLARKAAANSCATKSAINFHAYITGILKNQDSPLLEVNPVRDHIHILFVQSKNHAPAKIVEHVKTSSSRWIKEQHASYFDFAWQRGYGAFSVSPMHVEAVRKYIRNQAEHHKHADFQTEYRRFCYKNGKPLDDQYAWD
jgi:REP element-mobilizing transposase RayT